MIFTMDSETEMRMGVLKEKVLRHDRLSEEESQELDSLIEYGRSYLKWAKEVAGPLGEGEELHIIGGFVVKLGKELTWGPRP